MIVWHCLFSEMWKQTLWKFLKFHSGFLYNNPPFCEKPIKTQIYTIQTQISFVSRWTSAETAAPQGSAEVRSNLQAEWLPMAT